jgi:hypothetical protein
VDGLFASLPAEAAEALLDSSPAGGLKTMWRPRPCPMPIPLPIPMLSAAFAWWTISRNARRAGAAVREMGGVPPPAQRALAERGWNGPARVTGSAGTGKTIVALHRAVHIARADATAQVLMTTFSKPLAAALGPSWQS